MVTNLGFTSARTAHKTEASARTMNSANAVIFFICDVNSFRKCRLVLLVSLRVFCQRLFLFKSALNCAAARRATSFSPSAACEFLDLPPVSPRTEHLIEHCRLNIIIPYNTEIYNPLIQLRFENLISAFHCTFIDKNLSL